MPSPIDSNPMPRQHAKAAAAAAHPDHLLYWPHHLTTRLVQHNQQLAALSGKS